MKIAKIIGAILAGFLAVVILSTVADLAVSSSGLFPPINTTPMLAFALAYRILFTILGGAITAWISPESKMRSVWILAGLGQLAGIAGVFAGWNLSAHWYPLALALTAIPSVWLGGWLYTRTINHAIAHE